MGFFEPFDQARCTRCGECFHQCPVMELPLSEAQDEIKRLIAAEATKHVLRRCESCFACDLICPEHANPAHLILDRWNEGYRNEGIPKRAQYFIPHNQPNFRTYVLERLPEDEKAMLRSWAETTPAEEIFYPGCNWITWPHLAKSKLLEGLVIRGGLNHCCGEMYFRTAMYERLEEVAQDLKAWLGKMGTRRMLIPCTAGRNLFTNVLPQFGFDYELEVEHLLYWLKRRIESGEIKIVKPLNMTVTIQDSCHAKAFGDEYMQLPRDLLAMIGVKVIERRRSRARTLCCGIGGGFSHPSSYNPIKLTTSTLRSLSECDRTRADAIVTYCAGCAQMLLTGQISNPLSRTPIFHIFELVKIAAGEQTISRSEKLKRALHFILGVARHQGPLLISSQRGWLGKLGAEE